MHCIIERISVTCGDKEKEYDSMLLRRPESLPKWGNILKILKANGALEFWRNWLEIAEKSYWKKLSPDHYHQFDQNKLDEIFSSDH